jgi:hypothetical protein
LAANEDQSRELFLNGPVAIDQLILPQIDIPDIVGELLPGEVKSKEKQTGKPGGYKTLATFRLDTDFPLEDALNEYHVDPIPYVIALADIGKEVCEITYQTNATKYCEVLANQRLHQQRYYQLIEGAEGKFTMMTLREAFMPSQAVRILDIPKRFFRDRRAAILQNILNRAGLSIKSEISTSSTTVNWINELAIFRKNVIDFCKYAGSHVDENAPLQDIIQSLRTYAAEGKQKISPLFDQNAQLREKLEHCKRIRAALQIRHAIERLMAELPQSKKNTSKEDATEASTFKKNVPKATTAEKSSSKKARYDVWGSGPKWKRFWKDVWEDAQTNSENPFNKLFVDAKGPYGVKDIKRRGKYLFSDMSQDIHWYWNADIECAYFDDLTKKIAKILWPTDIDHATGEPKWELEIQKYPYKREGESVEAPPTEEPVDGSAAAEPEISKNSSGAALTGFSGHDTVNDSTLSHDHSKSAISEGILEDHSSV